MKMERGFTFIELMFVISIIAILGAIALPIYQSYIVRARVSEAIAGLGAHKLMVLENFANDADLGGHACDHVKKVSSATANVASLSCEGLGVLVVKTTPLAGSVTLTLTPRVSADNLLEWQCGRIEGKAIYAPPDCRSLVN